MDKEGYCIYFEIYGSLLKSSEGDGIIIIRVHIIIRRKAYDVQQIFACHTYVVGYGNVIARL